MRSDPKKLAAAALEVFSATEFDKATLSGVTRRLGLNRSVIYRYYASKRELLDKVIEEFCLDGELTNQNTMDALERLLQSDAAAKVLRIVLREWSNIPEIGAHYINALSAKIAIKMKISDIEEARRLAIAAVVPEVTAIVFSREGKAS
ncbi:hypothetical protein GCM10007913_33720 [Devosia yakushimensis]|uniref:HTH tetR-type domain-containing protein n=1 Tax=Devosia yakushimensis TaxID=470028 RepID=A0ABQ5UJU2_9HYPH|nr:hypothetical protein GCM10007913_33720 [Devosia yakushimensis]